MMPTDIIYMTLRSLVPNDYLEAQDNGTLESLLSQHRAEVAEMLGIEEAGLGAGDEFVSDAISILHDKDVEVYGFKTELAIDDLYVMLETGADNQGMSIDRYIHSLFPDSECVNMLETIYEHVGPMSPVITFVFALTASMPLNLAIATAYEVVNYVECEAVEMAPTAILPYSNEKGDWYTYEMQERYMRAALENLFPSDKVLSCLTKHLTGHKTSIEACIHCQRIFPMLCRELAGADITNESMCIFDMLTFF